MTLRISEAEFLRDARAILDKVERGDEVIVERADHSAVAVLKQPEWKFRSIEESIARAKAFEAKIGYAPVPDEDFARDVEEYVNSHREPIRNVWDE